ncbi:MAG: nitroreductase [Firmicutes bacterium]|nr:nitroreductase [Bacillota bacterium]
MPNINEIVKTRHSVRRYKDDLIPDNIVFFLKEKLAKINSDTNLNFQLILNDKETFSAYKLHYGKIYNCANYIALIGNKQSKNLDELVGYYGEKIVLEIQKLGLNTCWVGAGYSRKKLNIKLNRGERLVCVIALGYGTYPGKERPSKTYEEVSVTSKAPDWYSRGIEYALLAPTSMNRQNFKFELHENNVVSLKVGIGPFAKVDFGIVKYHFELGAGIQNFKWK